MSGRYVYPVLASDAGSVDLLMLLLHGVIALVFLGWLGYFFSLLWRFREKRHPHPLPRHPKAWWVYAFAAALLVTELSLDLSLGGRPSATATAEAAGATNALVVRVVAQQFQWNAHYPGADGVFGEASPTLIASTNPLGLDRSEGAGADDIVLQDRLYLPVNRPVQVRLSSKDVIHSFGLPQFRVKQDAIPGMEIPVRFTPTLTTAAFQRMTGDPMRTFELVCSQLCGLGHYYMRGEVHVLAPDAFAQWQAENAPAPDEADYDPFWN